MLLIVSLIVAGIIVTGLLYAHRHGLAAWLNGS